jgi:hypothetical protein
VIVEAATADGVDAGLLYEERLDLLRTALAKGQAVDVGVRGHCMRPWAFHGDRARVMGRAGALRPGEIVLIDAYPHGLLLHRVCRVDGEGWVQTQGDLHDKTDAWMPPASVLGVVASVERRSRLRLPVGTRAFQLAGLHWAPWLRRLKRVRRWLRAMMRGKAQWRSGSRPG